MSYQRGDCPDWWGMGGVGEAWIEGSGYFYFLLQCYSSALSALCYAWDQLELLKLHFVSLFIAASAFPRSAVVQGTLN